MWRYTKSTKTSALHLRLSGSLEWDFYVLDHFLSFFFFFLLRRRRFFLFQSSLDSFVSRWSRSRARASRCALDGEQKKNTLWADKCQPSGKPVAMTGAGGIFSFRRPFLPVVSKVGWRETAKKTKKALNVFVLCFFFLFFFFTFSHRYGFVCVCVCLCVYVAAADSPAMVKLKRKRQVYAIVSTRPVI